MAIEPESKKTLPLWIANLFFFSLLMVLVLVYFFWQAHGIDRSMQHNAMGRTRLVTGIVEENLRISDLASRAVEEMTYTLLNDKAHFIDYLDSVEPLHQAELTALARQSSLVGITLVRLSGTVVAGPPDWMSETPDCESAPLHIQYNNDKGYAYMMHPAPSEEGDLDCVIVGLAAEKILAVQKKTDLDVILETLSGLPGFHYIRLEKQHNSGDGTVAAGTIALRKDQYGYTAEARTLTSRGMLVVGLDASPFIQRRSELRHQFIVFSALLCTTGFFFSWLLYQYQKKNLAAIRSVEQMMAREHEAATLGRATATIAHEVRNPLNAINMGLQRLSIESELNPEQEQLIVAMREAVDRTSGIISGLQKFTTRLQPAKERLDFTALVQRQLTLYQPLCQEHAIEMESALDENIILSGDRDMLAELVENILKNGIEAQLHGGRIEVVLCREQKHCILKILNHGFLLSPADTERMGDPYFTTKTRGTGLGLALCRRIAEAHGGSLGIVPERKRQILTIKINIPLDVPTKDEQS